MTRRVMIMATNGVFDETLGNAVNNGASASDRLDQASQVRACTICVRAKAKCSTAVDIGGKCERCLRMNKDCQPSPPVRKRRTMERRTMKRPSTNEASKLEQKLDGLVTLLKSATQGLPGIIGTIPVTPPLDVSPPSIQETLSYSMAAVSDGQQEFIESEHSFKGLQRGIQPDLEPTPREAQTYLSKFRTDFIKHLPFIIIAPSMTADQLREERPLLWFSIMTTASTNSTQQYALSKEMRGILGREAYVEGTRSLDFILAVLVYISWERSHCFEKPIFISLVQLAIAILFDLALDKPPSQDPHLVMLYDLKGMKAPSRFLKSPTMEERRTLLGCFLMSSIACSTMRKGHPLRWTAYSEECLRVIEAHKEFESDILLVQILKLRLIGEKVVDAPYSGVMAGEDQPIKPLAMFYLNSLRSQLRDFKSNIPSELADNKDLLMETYNTELYINEIGLSQGLDIFDGQYNRLECLCACLNAAKCWFETFRSIPPAEYVGFSASVYSHMIHCYMGLYKLSTFEHPDWDKRLVRESVDVSSWMMETEQNFSQVQTLAGFGGSEEHDHFKIMASKIRCFRLWWDAKVPSFSATPSDEIVDFPMEFLNDDWLRDLVGPWNE